MLRTLIRQELLVHLMSARFFAAVVITVLLVVANTFVLLGAYEERLANYSQREAVIREKIADAPTYSSLRLRFARPPPFHRRARACPSPCLDRNGKRPWPACGFRAGRAIAGDRPPRYGLILLIL